MRLIAVLLLWLSGCNYDALIEVNIYRGCGETYEAQSPDEILDEVNHELDEHLDRLAENRETAPEP